jgi:AraC-like DNA-binding protein
MERWISAFWTERLIEVARTRGLDVAPLWARSGLSPGRSVDDRVSDSMHLALWNEVMRQSDSSFAIDFARSMRVDDYEALGLACKTAETLGAALERLVRYLALWTNAVELELTTRGADAMMTLRRPGIDTPGYRAAMESSVAELAGNLGALARTPVDLFAAYFAHAAPRDLSAHREFFRCALVFDAECYGVSLPAAALTTPLPLADPGLSRFLVAHLEERAASRGPPSLLQDVADAISRELPSGPPSVKRVAARLGLSPRTLQRRLAEADTRFQALVSMTRQTLARRLLLETNHSLPEIGFLLGFSEASAFHRAFRRAFGVTPAAFRKQNAAQRGTTGGLQTSTGCSE